MSGQGQGQGPTREKRVIRQLRAQVRELTELLEAMQAVPVLRHPRVRPLRDSSVGKCAAARQLLQDTEADDA